MSALTDERGGRYGRPADHFARTVAILGIVFGETRMCDLRREDWSVVMKCDKLARFAHTLHDEDSQLDVGGYSETWPMAQQEPSGTTLRVMRAVFDRYK